MDIATDLQRFDPHWRHARHTVRRALRPCIGLCAVLDCTDPSAASAATALRLAGRHLDECDAGERYRPAYSQIRSDYAQRRETRAAHILAARTHAGQACAVACATARFLRDGYSGADSSEAERAAAELTRLLCVTRFHVDAAEGRIGNDTADRADRVPCAI